MAAAANTVAVQAVDKRVSDLGDYVTWTRQEFTLQRGAIG
jgi:hypothetical protein